MKGIMNMEGWQQLVLDTRTDFTPLRQREIPPHKIQITQSKIFRSPSFQLPNSTNEDLVKRRQTNETLQLVRNFFKVTILYENNYPEGYLEELQYTMDKVESSEIQNKHEILSLLNSVQNKSESKILLEKSIDKIEHFVTKRQLFPYLPCAELRFGRTISKLNAKMLKNYYKIDCMAKHYQKIILSFLLILSEIDSSLKFLTSEMNKRAIACAKTYFSNPGNIIKNLRNVPSLVRENKIKTIVLKTVTEIIAEKIELKGSIKHLYKFIQEFHKLHKMYKPLFDNKLKRNDTLRKPNGKSLSQDSAAIEHIIQNSNEISERSDSFIPSQYKSALLKKFINQSIGNKASKRFKENTQCPIENLIRQRMHNRRRSIDRETIETKALVENKVPEDNIFNIII